MRAIETSYNGYKFRSRLEARWAVFFDSLKIRYEYEPEGFVLSDNICYLPDFYLPQLGVYVEVKASFEMLTEDDIIKIDSFSMQENSQLLLIVGSPGSQIMYLLNRCNMISINEVFSAYSDYTGNLVEMYNMALGDVGCEIEFASNAYKGGWTLAFPSLRIDSDDCRYKLSLLEARQSRFEFKDKQ